MWRRVSVICFLIVVSSLLLVLLSSLSRLLPFQTLADGLAFARGSLFFVFWISFLIIAVAARILDEGLKPGGEVERNREYKARLGKLLSDFEQTSDAAKKLAIMTEVERVIYANMRAFLQTNYEALLVI